MLLGLQQFDPVLPLGALLLETAKFVGQRSELLVEVLLRAQAMVAGVGVDAEIADHQRAADIEAERGQNSAKLSPGDHARQNASDPR